MSGWTPGTNCSSILVVFEDIKGCEGSDGGEGSNDRTRSLGIEEGFDVELDVLVLDGFDGLGMDDTGTVVGQLDGFVVGDLLPVVGGGVFDVAEVFQAAFYLEGGDTCIDHGLELLCSGEVF